MTPSRRRLIRGAAAMAATGLASGLAKAEGEGLSLKRLAAHRGLLFGCAVEPEAMDRDSAYADLVRRQCAMLTPENAMKWNALRPAADQFDFARADRVVALADAQDAQIHGHCLCWHEAMPDWLKAALTPDNARDLLESHIRLVAGRYAGRMHSWDVVNEPVERNDHRPDGLRKSPWLEAIGPDYIELAFRWAHEADPSARLDLSDYGLEYDGVPWMVEKRATVLTLLRGLIQRGAPIHALAIQGHLWGTLPASFGPGLGDFVSRVADLGLEIYVTELDVSDEKLPGDPASRDAVVGGLYRAFLDRMLRHPAVKLVGTWGLSDKYTSKSFFYPRADRQPVRPLPFDAEFRPKPAAYAMADAFWSG